MNFGREDSTSLFFHIRKFGVLRKPYEIDCTDGAVSLLGQNNFSDIFHIGVFIIIIVTIYKHNHVGILFDRAGLSDQKASVCDPDAAPLHG